MMNKKSFLCLGTLLFIKQLYAAPVNLDVFGVEPEIQNKIIASCKEDVKTYLDLSKKQVKGEKDEVSAFRKQMKAQKQLILSKVNAQGNFRLCELSVIYYPDDKAVYTTIDVVKAEESQRVPVAPKRVIKQINKNPEVTKLLKLWDEYNQDNMSKAEKGVLNFKAKSCPFNHCIWGFDADELKRLVPQFKALTLMHKNQLMDLVRYSDDTHERENAIFLLGHLEGYQGVVLFLTPYFDDPQPAIRNASMRVVGGILFKHKVSGVDVHHMIKALNYPDVTDRNKAVFILYSLIKKDKSLYPIVIQESGDVLLNLLKLKQPNNHDFAYLILRVMSGKNYSDRDYEHWAQWLDSERKKRNKA